MSIDEIERGLLSGHRIFGNVVVDIDSGGPGGRYQAFVQTPTYNRVIDTPPTVDTEGIITFCQRLAPEVAEILRQVDSSVK